MYRVNLGKKRWRTKWPWSWLFPLTIDERFCTQCKQPVHIGPLPQELVQLSSTNVAAVIYPAGYFGRDGFAVKIGRWKASAGRFYLSEYIDGHELDQVLEVAAQAREVIAGLSKTRARRR